MQYLGLFLVLYLGTVSPAVGPFRDQLWPTPSRMLLHQAAHSCANQALLEVTISVRPPLNPL